ncbi:MAG: flagellin [bacterium]|nr:flagellin [bacterium]MDY4100926.1 flagellin [Lachnospiraceae bacterium]
MKVNQNISAVISNAHLHRTENKLTASIERLSSGYKINKAKDSPAGMAISNKMRAQIMALDQSNRNAADGTSVMQTADGALNETHAMLQRMRELSVQAATDTMTTSDKEACQNEIEALQEEIDRIATDTEFNGKRILDGSQDYRVYPSIGTDLAGAYIRNFQTSDEVSAENYKFNITALPEQATMGVRVAPGAQTVEINGCSVEILATDTADDIFTKLKDIGETAGVAVKSNGGDSYTLTTFEYGKQAKIDCSINDVPTTAKPAEGKDAQIEMIRDTDQKKKPDGTGMTDANGDPVLYKEGFSETATYLSDGKKVTVRDLNGFEMVFEIDPEMDTGKVMETALNNGKKPEINLEMTDIGSMTLQIGAHENQVVEVRIPAVTCEALYIDDLNVVRKGGADKALAALDDAIAQVSEVRSRIGAYQNRLEYAVSSLDGTEENMEAAISRIMDTDMAEEMSTYSNMNVLDQAAISVLTQANDMPQQVLQLLQ